VSIYILKTRVSLSFTLSCVCHFLPRLLLFRSSLSHFLTSRQLHPTNHCHASAATPPLNSTTPASHFKHAPPATHASSTGDHEQQRAILPKQHRTADLLPRNNQHRNPLHQLLAPPQRPHHLLLRPDAGANAAATHHGARLRLHAALHSRCRQLAGLQPRPLRPRQLQLGVGGGGGRSAAAVCAGGEWRWWTELGWAGRECVDGGWECELGAVRG